MQKAISIVAYCLRFIANCKTAAQHRFKGGLTFDECERAKVVLLRTSQRPAFREYDLVCSNKPVPKGCKLWKLNPFVDADGLLRVKGRIQRSGLTYAEKHPIIVAKGWLAKLIINLQHVLLKHAGVDSVLTSLREVYWIFGVRRLAKEVKRSCFMCQWLDSKPVSQPAAPLPAARVSQAPPFSVCGLDYAGPLYCIDAPKVKFYVLLFTCAVVRAVHLELVDSMSLDVFMLAFRRFSSRRGLANVMYSDNAKTFKAAQAKLLQLYGPNCPKWQFIVPRAPWWGGWWERLVKSVKVSLRKSVGSKCLTRVELETTLVEVEGCINSRPLTFVRDEADSTAPLTPFNFLSGNSRVLSPSICEQATDVKVDPVVRLKETYVFRPT